MTVRAVEQKLREIRACVQRERDAIPKVIIQCWLKSTVYVINWQQRAYHFKGFVASPGVSAGPCQAAAQCVVIEGSSKD